MNNDTKPAEPIEPQPAPQSAAEWFKSQPHIMPGPEVIAIDECEVETLVESTAVAEFESL